MNKVVCGIFVVIFLTLGLGYEIKNKLKATLVSQGLELKKMAEQYMKENSIPYKPSEDYPYFGFIPPYIDSIKLGGSASWKSNCFENNVGTANLSSDGTTIDVKITSTGPTSTSCEELYAALTTSTINLSFNVKSGVQRQTITEISLEIPSDVTDAEKWDFNTKGVRIYRYLVDRTTALSNLLKTFEIFVPELTLSVPKFAAEANIDFMAKYTHFEMPPRDQSLNIIPNETDIHSGDTFYIIRLDGLDPMLAWAMGSTTGHVTTALWIDGELYVCESTIADSYWPTDYVQRTPYRTWIQQAQDADFNVVFAPLNEQARAAYNETAAVEWFKSVEGLDYGFQTMLWGWMDTTKDNFPCMPPDFSSNCLQWELLEPLLAFVDRKSHDAGVLWNFGYAKRLGVSDQYRTSDLYQIAYNHGYKSTVDVVPAPEQDVWLYNTTRNGDPAVGRAMVCCVFACGTWKAAGVFGELTDSINCAEQTNWDDYVLTIHADTYQQIMGAYTLKLNDFHTKTPYAHMAETCPSLAPDYTKPDNC